MLNAESSLRNPLFNRRKVPKGGRNPRYLCTCIITTSIAITLLIFYFRVISKFDLFHEQKDSKFTIVTTNNDILLPYIPTFVPTFIPTSISTIRQTTILPTITTSIEPLTMDEEQELVYQYVKEKLQSHPFQHLSEKQKQNFSLPDYFVLLQKQKYCQKLPIFTSMANVYSELYWQL
jgi:hypothetical protein